MTDTAWARIRPLPLPLPLPPAWLEGRGGKPEGCCPRQILDAIRHLVDNGVKWRSMPTDFPARDRVTPFPAAGGTRA